MLLITGVCSVFVKEVWAGPDALSNGKMIHSVLGEGWGDGLARKLFPPGGKTPPPGEQDSAAALLSRPSVFSPFLLYEVKSPENDRF